MHGVPKPVSEILKFIWDKRCDKVAKFCSKNIIERYKIGFQSSNIICFLDGKQSAHTIGRTAGLTAGPYRQPHSPGWARDPLSSFFTQIVINFSWNLTYFLPHFRPSGGQVAHPGRPWLRHWLWEVLESRLTCYLARSISSKGNFTVICRVCRTCDAF